MIPASFLLGAALLSPPTAYDLVTAAEIRSVAVAPDGKSAVFTWTRLGDADLWLLPLTGGEPRLLVAEPGDEDEPSFSSDGDNVVFVGEGRDGREDVFVVRVADGAMLNLTDDPASDRAPRFTADGRVAFLSDRDGHGMDLWVVEPGAKARPVRLSRGGGLRAQESDAAGQWVRVQKRGRGNDEVRFLPLGGGRGTRIARGLVTRGLPVRSPDGSRLALGAMQGPRGAIALLSPRGGQVGWLPPEDEADHISPRFSPRGDALAFVRRSSDAAQLVVRMLDGSGMIQASPADGSVSSFAWVPDGSGLIYTYGHSTLPRSLYWAGLEGRPPRLLVDAAPSLAHAELSRARRVRIPRSDAPPLLAWVVAPKPERAGRAVVLVRERTPDTPDEFVPVVQFLVSHRYAVVVLTLGADEPWGKHHRPHDAVGLQDVALAANWMVREALAAPGRIGVFGEGWLGGHVALAAAAAAPDRLRAAVTVGGATDLVHLDDRTPPDARARLTEVLGSGQRATSPRLLDLEAVLWIYGARDPLIGPAQRLREQLLARGAQSPAVFYDDEGSPLRGRRTRANAMEQVVDFFMKRL